MITLDRDAPLQIADQIVEGLRYEIGAGTYRPGERLPSTRAFGEQLGVSFHTVRKAYQTLAAEGALDAHRGGYSVAERTALTRAERLERAAGVVQDALHRLVSLGLSEDEMEYAVEEGLQFYERPGRSRHLLFAAPYRELAESGAEQATGALQERVTAVLVGDLTARTEAEGVVAPLAVLRDVRRVLPETETVGVVVHYPHAALEHVARLDASETLVLVTRYADAIAPLLDEVGARTGFAGHAVALTIEADKRQLETALRQARVVLYTPQARRRLRALLAGLDTTALEVAPTLAPESLARIREALAV
ncbi:MAG TPA: GntR family transcriptional regulator [Rubricoccaceae bacterium]